MKEKKKEDLKEKKMDNLVVLQLLGLINPEFDQIEMTSDDIKYLNDPIIQTVIRKIKLLCFKFAINNNLNSEKFRYEISLILSGYDQEKRNYLETYANDLTNKMQNVINPPEIKENLDNNWRWGDEVSPKR